MKPRKCVVCEGKANKMSAKRLTDDAPLFICPICLMAGYRFDRSGQAVNIRLAARMEAIRGD